MKRLTAVTVDNWVSTIECIIASPILKRYNIGITSDVEGRKKGYKYFSPSWPHFVVLRSGLDAKLAIEAEKQLYEHLTSDKSSLNYEKYRGDTKHKKYVPSLGGAKGKEDYALYIAWGTEKSYAGEN